MTEEKIILELTKQEFQHLFWGRVQQSVKMKIRKKWQELRAKGEL